MTDRYNISQKLIHPENKQFKSVCFYTFNFQDALSHLRMMGPASHLGLEVIEGVENGQVFVDRALLGDVIVLQRDFPRSIEAYEKILSLARQNRIPVILDIDDFLFELPDDHPDHLTHIFTWTLLPIFQAILEVDLVTVTTRALHDFVQDYNKNVMLLPNFLDDQIWQLRPPVRKNIEDEKVIIGYMGGLTHQPDLALLIPVFRNIIERFPEKLGFQFWGVKPPEELSIYPNFHWNYQITWNYPDFAAQFQAQSADIFIAPLVNNTFNNRKSCIKYLEYGSLGVPGVFSKAEPYTEVITHGKNGFLASTIEEWEDCLIQLIEKPDLRYTIASNALADIQSNWLLSRNASRWLSAFQTARDARLAGTFDETIYLKMIKILSRQTVMGHRYINDQLNMQNNKIAELNETIANMGATISGITNSDSWKLALAFRRFREAIAPPNSRREKVFQGVLAFFSSKKI